MPDREERDVEADVTQPVEEEDDAEEEQQMVVAGDHVLGAEIQERHQAALLHERLVGGRDAMGREIGGRGQDQHENATPHLRDRPRGSSAYFHVISMPKNARLESRVL